METCPGVHRGPVCRRRSRHVAAVGVNRQAGQAGLTLPGSGISTTTAMLWELVLTAGLVSVILGTASGAQQIGPLAALGVGAYIALAGPWGSPVSGASMNPTRSLGPALVKGDWSSWWAYLVGPAVGAALAVGFAHVLRGRGGGRSGVAAAVGTLGVDWHPGLGRDPESEHGSGRPTQLGPPMDHEVMHTAVGTRPTSQGDTERRLCRNQIAPTPWTTSWWCCLRTVP